jgi:predicted phage terminase large subunit-like protein
VTKKEVLDMFERDALLMGRVCMPTMFKVKTPPFHREIADAYHNHANTRIVVIAPRGHAKSSLVACVLVLHHIMFDKGPKVVVLASKTVGHAERLLQTIKNVLDYSLPFRKFFGYWGEHSAGRWTNSEVVLKDNTLIVTRGTGQQVVGLKHGDQRPTLLVMDDPEDTENTKTTEAMEKNLRWLFTQFIPTRDAQRGRVIVIGTPQHQRCIVEILMTAKGWKQLRYKAIQDDGTALWPEQWSVEKLLEEKATCESMNRVSMWYREYQCQILSDEEQLFRESDLRYWNGHFDRDDQGNAYLAMEDDQGNPTANVPVTVFMGIDPAVSTAGTADYTVIMCCAVDADNNRYILPFVRKRMNPSLVIDTIQTEDIKYRPLRKRLETSGQQEIYADVLRNLERAGSILVTHKPRDSKSKRYLEGLEPYFVKHKVYIQRSMADLKEELLQFRSDGRHAHDDMLDAMYYSFRNVYPPAHQVERNQSAHSDPKSKRLSWSVS